ncbi:hypothetical protein PoB_000882900 [Plakobranchus ocellatus]|uniref:Uncharacterized protein n=1 Tax=Plakobranchus ocellatus TaxID=259542 RepID=A0AAV3YJ67_9GAST|nr:hypothetical protein PoB_000882900 [Plakobranchus ocellatus]
MINSVYQDNAAAAADAWDEDDANDDDDDNDDDDKVPFDLTISQCLSPWLLSQILNLSTSLYNRFILLPLLASLFRSCFSPYLLLPTLSNHPPFSPKIDKLYPRLKQTTLLSHLPTGTTLLVESSNSPYQ